MLDSVAGVEAADVKLALIVSAPQTDSAASDIGGRVAASSKGEATSAKGRADLIDRCMCVSDGLKSMS